MAHQVSLFATLPVDAHRPAIGTPVRVLRGVDGTWRVVDRQTRRVTGRVRRLVLVDVRLVGSRRASHRRRTGAPAETPHWLLGTVAEAPVQWGSRVDEGTEVVEVQTDAEVGYQTRAGVSCRTAAAARLDAEGRIWVYTEPPLLHEGTSHEEVDRDCLGCGHRYRGGLACPVCAEPGEPLGRVKSGP